MVKKVEVPGGADIDPNPEQPEGTIGFPGSFVQPSVEANPAKTAETARLYPEALTLEQMQAEFLLMKQRVDAQDAIIKEQQSKQDVLDQKLEPITMSAAKKQAQDHIDNGRSPPSILTTEGWYVHQLANSGVDDVEKQQERDAKAKARDEKKSD